MKITITVLALSFVAIHADAQESYPKNRKIDGIMIKQLSERAVLVNDDTFGLIVVRGIHPNVGATVKLSGIAITITEMPWRGSSVMVEIVDAK